MGSCWDYYAEEQDQIRVRKAEETQRAQAARLPAGGVKFDQGKLRFDLMPPEALEEIAAVFTCGANKYGVRNWEAGMDWGRCFGATMRHLWAWWRGEEKDSESGISHLAHAAAGIMFLITYSKRNIGLDDRRKQK